jgi:hypothetical protein
MLISFATFDAPTPLERWLAEGLNRESCDYALAQ